MDADGARVFRGGNIPHVCLALGHRCTRPDDLAPLLPPGWRFSNVDLHDLHEIDLACIDVLVVPDTHDELYLKSIEARLTGYLHSGGHLLVNGQITLPWLPYLSPYTPVSPRPYTNWLIRPADPGNYFGRMDFATFHMWGGILGHYARGFSKPPAGAQALCLVGPDAAPEPCDWVWRSPGGGKLFMHSGDDIYLFCSEPDRQPNLFQDVLRALIHPDEPSLVETSGPDEN